MSIKKYFAYSLLISFLTIAYPLLASTKGNRVVLVKGEATILSTPQHQAVEVIKGQRVQAGDSIVTGPKSFVKVIFKNDSTLLVSPNSKVVVKEVPEMTNNTVIGLLRGNVRSQVKKEHLEKPKYKILTRTASLGVRGTDFIATYNPENKVSTNLTINGLVEIDKMNNTQKRLASFGQLISADNEMKTSTTPVRIAPDQLAYLRLAGIEKNKELIEKEFNKVLEEYREAGISNTKLPEGGYLDFKTGLYIIPERNGLIYDKKLKMYRTAKIGHMLNEDGSFKPSEGYIVHPLYGYIKKADLSKMKNQKRKGLSDLYKQYKKLKVQIERANTNNTLRVNP